MIDLYALHERKANAGLLTIHPARWLSAGRRMGRGGVYTFFEERPQHICVGGRAIENFRRLDLIDSGPAVAHKHGYYLASPLVADNYYKHVPQHAQREQAVRDMLHIRNPLGKLEVYTPVGFIDMLLPNAVVEIKNFTRWKHALGQVLAYGLHYPDHTKIIHAYVLGERKPDLKPILSVCERYGVSFIWQSLVSSELGPLSRLTEPNAVR